MNEYVNMIIKMNELSVQLTAENEKVESIDAWLLSPSEEAEKLNNELQNVRAEMARFERENPADIEHLCKMFGAYQRVGIWYVERPRMYGKQAIVTEERFSLYDAIASCGR